MRTDGDSVTLRHPSIVLKSNSGGVETSPAPTFFVAGGFHVCAWSHGISGSEQEADRQGFESLTWGQKGSKMAVAGKTPAGRLLSPSAVFQP